MEHSAVVVVVEVAVVAVVAVVDVVAVVAVVARTKYPLLRIVKKRKTYTDYIYIKVLYIVGSDCHGPPLTKGKFKILPG